MILDDIVYLWGPLAAVATVIGVGYLLTWFDKRDEERSAAKDGQGFVGSNRG